MSESSQNMNCINYNITKDSNCSLNSSSISLQVKATRIKGKTLPGHQLWFPDLNLWLDELLNGDRGTWNSDIANGKNCLTKTFELILLVSLRLADVFYSTYKTDQNIELLFRRKHRVGHEAYWLKFRFNLLCYLMLLSVSWNNYVYLYSCFQNRNTSELDCYRVSLSSRSVKSLQGPRLLWKHLNSHPF